jgi:hypothetical protein
MLDFARAVKVKPGDLYPHPPLARGDGASAGDGAVAFARGQRGLAPGCRFEAFEQNLKQGVTER